MYKYTGIESQKLFDDRQNYLRTVTKEQFLNNDDSWFYAREVQNGNIPVCEYIKKAVQREQDKLSDPDCPYYYDPEPGFKFFAFCRYFYHLKGPLGGQHFILSDWQIWLFSMLLGWKRKTGQNKGFRQYKIAYLECPRGSGKSAIMALFGLFMLSMDDEWEPEVYVAATKKEQANLLFNSVIRQIEYGKNKKIANHLKVKRRREYIERYSAQGGTFKSLSKDSKSFDGMNIHCALVDEVHAHPTAEIWEILKSGANKRKQSMMVAITTAGHNFNGFGYQFSNFIKKMLEGKLTDDEKKSTDNVFGCVWTIDKGDEIYDQKTWIKANPSWYAAINHEDFAADIMRTISWPETKAETYTKLLNIWYHSNDKWLDPEFILKANSQKLNENDFKSTPCIIGVDLAYAEDMLAYVNVYEKWNDEDKQNHYYVFPKYFTPDVNLRRGDRPQYNRWSHEDLLTVLPGDIINFDVIQNFLEDEYQKGRVLEFAFDRYNAHQMAGSLQNKYGEHSVYYIQQTMSGLNEASKFFKRLLLEGRIHFDNDIFVWNCVNAVVKINATGLIQVTKDESSPKDKVDGLIACINALERYQVRSVEPKPFIMMV